MDLRDFGLSLVGWLRGCAILTLLLAPVAVREASARPLDARAAAQSDSLSLAIGRLLREEQLDQAASAIERLDELARESGTAFLAREAEQWRTMLRSLRELSVEQRALMSDALRRRDEGRQLYREARFAESNAALVDAMQGFGQHFAYGAWPTAEARSDLAQVLRGMAQFDAAESLQTQAAAELDSLLGADHPKAALARLYLGSLLAQRGRFEQAAAFIRTAEARLESVLGPRSKSRALALHELGETYRLWGHYEEAETSLRQALTLRRQLFAPSDVECLETLHALAAVLERRGDLWAAEPITREVAARAREIFGARHPNVAAANHNLGKLLVRLGEPDLAKPLFEESISIARESLGAEHPAVASGLMGLAEVARLEENWPEMLRLAEEALVLRQAAFGSDHPLVSLCLSILGESYARIGRLEDAARTHAEALRISRLRYGSGSAEAAALAYEIGIDRLLQGRLEEGETEIRKAVARIREAHGPHHPDGIVGLASLALALEAEGRLAEAESCLVEACAIYDQARLRVPAGAQRSTFLESPYPRLAAVLAKRGRSEEAWKAMERGQARTLAELLQNRERELSPTDSSREEALRHALDQAVERWNRVQSALRSDSSAAQLSERDAARNGLWKQEAEWGEWQRALDAAHPLREGDAFPLRAVQQQLDDRSALLSWVDVESRVVGAVSWVCVVRANGAPVWAQIPIPADSLGRSARLVRELRAEIEKVGGSLLPSDAPDGSPALGSARLRDLAMLLARERILLALPALAEADRWIVVPSGPMLGLPIEVLVETMPLLDAPRPRTPIAVSYAPSATLYAWLRDQEIPSNATRAFVVGDPPFTVAHLKDMEQETELFAAAPHMDATGAGWRRQAVLGDSATLAALPRLPGTRAEARAIARCFRDPVVVLGAEASEARVRSHLSSAGEDGFRAVHFATHALVDDRFPDRSAVVLSQLDRTADGAEADGLLRAREIASLPSFHADLVVLSGCETALGRAVRGEGYLGLAQAFLRSGARSMIVSLWSVDDRATALLMERFYQNWTNARPHLPFWGADASRAAALRDAKAWLREYRDPRGARPYAHPYYWAGFVLIGDNS